MLFRIFYSATELIALLTSELLAGNQGTAGDYLQGLVFCVIAYPILLLLLWLLQRGGAVEIAKHAESGDAADGGS